MFSAILVKRVRGDSEQHGGHHHHHPGEQHGEQHHHQPGDEHTGGGDIHKNTQGNKPVIFVVCKNCYKDHPILIVRELIKAKNSLICAKI